MTEGKQLRGFALLSEERRREVASQGGKSAQERGAAHQFSSEEAREAGRKGGAEANRRGTLHQFTLEEQRVGGRAGGLAPHEPRKRKNKKKRNCIHDKPIGRFNNLSFKRQCCQRFTCILSCKLTKVSVPC